MKSFNFLTYNTDFKIAGNTITYKTYEDTQFYNYMKKASIDTKMKTANIFEIAENFMENLKNYKWAYAGLVYKILQIDIQKEKEERFIKSCFRARQAIFDLIQCNTGKWKDFNGKNQTVKFLTLTFKENISDITKANKELTKFFKRLSYHQFGVRKNVIKYIVVPELQDRGAWHYHIILFNSKYVPFYDLKTIWGNGSVYINALQRNMDVTDIAKYITKYVTKALKVDNENKDKNNLGNYKTYLKFEMVNKKRYSCSRGLYRPWKAKLKMEQKEATALANYLIGKAIERNGEKQVYFKEYYNEHRGTIQIVSVELNKKQTKQLKDYLKIRFKHDIEIHSRQEKINWKKLNNIRKKTRKDILLYDLEKRYEVEEVKYRARQSMWAKEECL